MPVCSYIVHPAEGKAGELIDKLKNTPGCNVTPSDNQELLILVTETWNFDEERQMQEMLRSIPEIDCLALAFGQIKEELKQGVC